MAKKKKTISFGKKIRRFLFICTILTATAVYFVPGAAHSVRYYGYELYDKVMVYCGLAPHCDNLDLGSPEGREEKIDRIFNREGYAFGYSDHYEQSLWVTYKLTRKELQEKKVFRTDDFREDPRVLSRTALPEDYKKSGYDRGHLAPAADFGWSKKVMSESFYMSNMSPQHPNLNRGIWLNLEKKIRDIARKESEIFIVCGPVFDDDEEDIKRIGQISKVAVPKGFYKVVYDLTPPRKMIGFIFPNRKCGDDLSDYAVTVKKVEAKTGLTFFPALGQDKLKNTVTVSDWNLDGKTND